MNPSVMDAASLKGHGVAVTGKLAAMPRAQVIRLVRDRGGVWCPTVSRQTTLLVIGQEGWPLRVNGRLSGKLMRAKSLASHQKIDILSEGAFFERIGIESSASLGNVSTARLSELLSIPGHRIRQWVEWGLITPSQTVDGVHHFDFQQVSFAKTLCDCLTRGVSIAKLRRSVQTLQRWLPQAEAPLAQLSVLEKDGRLMVRVREALVEPSGQRTLAFPDDELEPVSMPLAAEAPSAAEWFSQGYDKECAEDFAGAEKAYRYALNLSGPNAETSFNLANVLYAQGKKVRAVERYWQVVEIDRTHADAWNNLGRVLEELAEPDEAILAYQWSLRADPHGLDALYNLADLLDELGRTSEAMSHWKAYLQVDRYSEWADHARKRLNSA